MKGTEKWTEFGKDKEISLIAQIPNNNNMFARKA